MGRAVQSYRVVKFVLLTLPVSVVTDCNHVEPALHEQSSSSTRTTQLTYDVTPTAQTKPGSTPSLAPNPPLAPIADSRTTKTDASPRPCLLLAVGDSLTDPKSAGGGYLKPLETRCGCTIVNLGKGGDMVNQMKRRLLAHLDTTSQHYSDVLVFGGVNDLYSDLSAKRTVAKISQDLRAMYLAAKAHGARVIAVTVTPWGGFRRFYNESRAKSTKALNAFIATTATQNLSDYWVDAFTALSCGDPERLCDRYASPFKDGLHFGPLGHQRLGEALVQALGKERCTTEPDTRSVPPPSSSPSPEASRTP